MLEVNDLKEFLGEKRIFIGSEIKKIKLNNFLKQLDIKFLPHDNGIIFIDESLLGLWGEGVFIDRNYLFYNLSGKKGYIPLFNIIKIEFKHGQVIINSNLSLLFKKVKEVIFIEIFKEMAKCIDRNDLHANNLVTHEVDGPAHPIDQFMGNTDPVTRFFEFALLNDNRDKIIEFIGFSNIKDDKSAIEYISKNTNLKELSEKLIDFSGLTGDDKIKTIEFFYLAFKYYSVFLFKHINNYRSGILREDRKKEDLRIKKEKEELSQKKVIENISLEKEFDKMLFCNMLEDKKEPFYNFFNGFLSIVNGYAKRYKMNEKEYVSIININIEYHLYILAEKEILQQSETSQTFLFLLVMFLDSNRNRLKDPSFLLELDNEKLAVSLFSIMLLIENNKAGKKAESFEYFYEKAVLSNQGISENEFIDSLSALKRLTYKLIFDIFSPEIEKSNKINELF